MAEKIYLLDAPTAQTLAQAAYGGPQAVLAPPLPSFEEVPDPWTKPAVTPLRRPFHSGRTLLATYALGGVAPLAFRVGPRQFAWASLSVLSLAGWGALVWYWDAVRAAMQSGRLPILPAMVGLALVHIVGALAWSRGVSLVVRDERFQPRALPRAVRHPLITAILGFGMPGMGLAIAGRARRAGFAVWNAASTILAALVTMQAALLWTWNTKSGVNALPKPFVEWLLVGAAVVAVAGALAWIASALDGARLVEQRRAQANRGFGKIALLRADAAAVGLVTALVALAVTFHPASVARDLDQFAGAMRFDGYRVIPLAM